LFVKL